MKMIDDTNVIRNYDSDNGIMYVMMPLPYGSKVDEAVTKNKDDTYTIIVNANRSPERRAKAIQHALQHIRKNDFEKADVQEIEGEMN